REPSSAGRRAAPTGARASRPRAGGRPWHTGRARAWSRVRASRAWPRFRRSAATPDASASRTRSRSSQVLRARVVEDRGEARGELVAAELIERWVGIVAGRLRFALEAKLVREVIAELRDGRMGVDRRDW